MDELEWARKFFTGDRYAVEVSGISIDELAGDFARCSFIAGERHLNAAGTVMGGALFTLADFAFAVAANRRGGPLVQSLTSQITYHSAAKCGRSSAEARCIRRGRTTCYFNTTLTDDAGKLIATVVTTGYIHPDISGGEK